MDSIQPGIGIRFHAQFDGGSNFDIWKTRKNPVMDDFAPFLNKDDIENIVQKLGAQISEDYKKSNELVLIGVLKGAFIFLADLARHISIPVTIDFIRASSYGSAATSSGVVKIQNENNLYIQEKEVLLVEDIVDTGLTLTNIIQCLNLLKPQNIKVCALLDKYERRAVDVRVDYAGCKVKHGFLVGYGLDYDERNRNLSEIYTLNAT